MKNVDTERNAHTPVTLMTVFANAFKIDRDRSVLWLKGVYLDRRRRSYKGYYFDRLQDELSGQIVTLKLPDRIKQTINHGELYLFKGVLDKDVRKDGVIEPVFIVSELGGEVDSLLPDGMERRADIQEQKARAGYRDLDQAIKQKLYQGNQPRILLICGATSIVLRDVIDALKDARNHYDLEEHRVSLAVKEAIIDAIARHDNDKFDVIVIIRGGGPGLKIFDDIEIAKASLGLQPIMVTAIGHAEDEVTLLERVADRRFITPTALGAYLREMVQSAQEEKVHSKTELKESYENQLKMIKISWIVITLMLLVIAFALGLIFRG